MPPAGARASFQANPLKVGDKVFICTGYNDVIALDAANNSALISRSSYRAGLADFLMPSQSEAALISARNGLLQARSDQATALIQLYLALGGGWDASTIPTPERVPAPATPGQD